MPTKKEVSISNEPVYKEAPKKKVAPKKAPKKKVTKKVTPKKPTKPKK